MARRNFIARKYSAKDFPAVVKEFGEVTDVFDYNAKLKERFSAGTSESAIRSKIKCKYNRDLDFF